jgi:geranylgeranyl diphosphate synthase type II
MEVCEGQDLDMAFESREDVTITEYLEMIRLKTAVLLGGSMKMGAIFAGAEWTAQNHLYQCGEEMGLAFQLLDDYLDAFGNPEEVGKRVGGDIIADKKTFLRIKLYEKATNEELDSLQEKENNPNEKVLATQNLLRKYQIDDELLNLAKSYSDSAIDHLNAIEVNASFKAPLEQVIFTLLNRKS